MTNEKTVQARLIEMDHFRVPYGHLSEEKKETLRAVLTAILGQRPLDTWVYLEQVEA